jgi:hypothetical protein
MPTQKSKSHVALINVPELVYSIAQLCGSEACAHLALTSKALFYLTIPLAWETVHGATQLFKLLPGTNVGVRLGPGGTETVVSSPKYPKDMVT